jgi:folate-binding protein YgfZ
MLDVMSAPKAPTDLAWFAIPDARIIALTGEDRAEWLQGQITQDVRSGSGTACLCKPTGQLLSIIRFAAQEDRVLLSAEPAQPFLDRVEEAVIMEDVAVQDLGDCFAIQGEGAAGLIPSRRSLLGGFDGLEPAGREMDLGEYQLRTLEAKVPLVGLDTDDKTLPPELGSEFDSESTSYNKGCYVGQEILMRIKSRGHTNKTWVLVTGEEMTAGSQITAAGKRVGQITRVSGDLAGAVIRNSALDQDLEIDGRKIRIC